MTQIVCANCGQALRPTDKFCYNCGAKVQPIKLKPEVEKEVPKAEPIKPAPSVLRPQVPVRPEAPKEAPEKMQEERPKFHMDEAMSWNTDGYPEAKRHPVQDPENADFIWNESAQDRIRKRQEEGRRSLYEEQEADKAAEEKAYAKAEESFAAAPEAEDVVKAVDAGSTVPVDDFRPQAAQPEAAAPAVQEAPEEAAAVVEAPETQRAPEAPAVPDVPEAPAAQETPAEEKAVPEEGSFRAAYQEAIAQPVPETPAAVPAEDQAAAGSEAPLKEEPVVAPTQTFRDAYQAAVAQPETDETAEADDDYVVPTIESIEKDAEAARARQTEKEIFGYTLDDIDSGARKEGSSGAEVIDKFYTYSKKQEEFQALLDQENERIKGGRQEAAPAASIQDELDKAVADVKEAAQEKPIETGGFVGVQLPETPGSVEAYKAPEEPEAAAPQAQQTDPYKAPGPVFTTQEAPAENDAYKAPEAGNPEEFLGGNFGKADDIAKSAGSQADEDRTAAAATVAAAAGAVVSGAAAIAAAREKAREKIEAEKAASAVQDEVQAAAPAEAPEAPETPETPEEAPSEILKPITAKAEEAAQPESRTESGAFRLDIPAGKAEDKPFGEVITEESEKAREKSLAEAAEEAARVNAAEIKAAEEAAREAAAASSVPLEEAQRSVDKTVEETAAAAEEEKAEAETAEGKDHKLTYQDVFNENVEKTPKHTFLKVIAILILLLIILEVAAILIRRFAPDSAVGLQIQQIYEMIFDRFI